MSGIYKSKTAIGPLLALLALVAVFFATAAPAGAATNIFTDNFSNIAGWNRRGVVLNFGLSWEGTMLQDPSVLYNQGGGAPFKMWYGAATRIGYATSNDGISWTKSANPVLVAGPNGSTDDSWLTVPSVVYSNGVYYMTYCGNDGSVARIHLATATNPAGPWTKQGVVLSPDQAYEDNFLYNSSLMLDNGQWKMWYTAGRIASAGGEPEFIAYATAPSAAGPWTKYGGNPIVRPMADGGWASLGVGGPNVMKRNNTYYMTMLGWQNDYPSRGGRLTSTDGINWSLSRDKMHYDLGTAGTWEDAMIYRQFVVDVNGTEYMYYNAKDTQPGWNERIGLAIWSNSVPIIDPAKWSKTFGANAAGGGTFAIDAGRLRTLGLAPAGSQQNLQGNIRINATNYSISADVTPISSADVQKDNVLIIRATDMRNYYYGGIGSWGAKYAIGKQVGGANTRLASTGTASQITPNATYKLKLVANGSTLQLYDNGVLVLSATDTSLAPASSYVGLETANPAGQAYFDNVSVDTVDSVPPSGVVFYQDINYGGTASGVKSIGDYASLPSDVPDNWMSSLRIPAGWIVEAYASANFGGAVCTYTADTSWVGSACNDTMSSFKIRDSVGVIFYQDINYGGAASGLKAKGDYSALPADVPNDWMSSLRVPSGWTVEAYEHSSFGGAVCTYTADTSWVGSTCNDRMSSFRIR